MHCAYLLQVWTLHNIYVQLMFTWVCYMTSVGKLSFHALSLSQRPFDKGTSGYLTGRINQPCCLAHFIAGSITLIKPCSTVCLYSELEPGNEATNTVLTACLYSCSSYLRMGDISAVCTKLWSYTLHHCRKERGESATIASLCIGSDIRCQLILWSVQTDQVAIISIIRNQLYVAMAMATKCSTSRHVLTAKESSSLST